jgi:hypothetical protein
VGVVQDVAVRFVLLAWLMMVAHSSAPTSLFWLSAHNRGK